jgi:hypothetical protein
MSAYVEDASDDEDMYVEDEQEVDVDIEELMEVMEDDPEVDHTVIRNLACWIILQNKKSYRKFKKRKKVINREAPWEFINSWDDKLFKQQFRVPRDEFYNLLNKMISVYPGRKGSGPLNYAYAKQQGDNSSKTHVPLELKLCVALRLLAGASYLDMIWFGVGSANIHRTFEFTVNLIDKAIPDKESFAFPTCEEEFIAVCQEWSDIQIRKRGIDLMPGTFLAGDGVVIQIACPSVADRAGLDLTAYRNRKGYFGLIVQAFCDAYGKFRYFEVNWPGSTNDITAYNQTDLRKWFTDNVIPSWCSLVLDEAYSSIGGDQHMTPFTRYQLRKVARTDRAKYLKMKAFNHILSSQRITIERAFGMMVMKWGILFHNHHTKCSLDSWEGRRRSARWEGRRRSARWEGRRRSARWEGRRRSARWEGRRRSARWGERRRSVRWGERWRSVRWAERKRSVMWEGRRLSARWEARWEKIQYIFFCHLSIFYITILY